MVEQGRFRQDLYDRISVVCLKLSSLRHRAADIEALAEAFRDRFAHEFGKNIIGFTQDALESLMKYDWPGNIRELKAVIRRGVILCQGTRITSGHVASSPSYSHPSPGAAARAHLPLAIRPLKEALEEPEKRIIVQALQALNWNRQETARVLDINRTTLYKKMKKYGLLVDGPIWVN
jgi:DNA-binding NtrC family response regulator